MLPSLNDHVRKQIEDSRKTLNTLSPELGKHLKAIRKEKENGCWVYDPEKTMDWI